MDFSDVSLTSLPVFRAVAEQGTFTAAAAALGYTQSAVRGLGAPPAGGWGSVPGRRTPGNPFCEEL